VHANLRVQAFLSSLLAMAFWGGQSRNIFKYSILSVKVDMSQTLSKQTKQIMIFALFCFKEAHSAHKLTDRPLCWLT